MCLKHPAQTAPFCRPTGRRAAWLRLALLIAAAAAVEGGLLKLAHWQYTRAHFKTAQAAHIASVLATTPPQKVRAAAQLPAPWHGVQLQGMVDASRAHAVVSETAPGQAGLNVIAPLRLPGGGSVLVDVGTLPAGTNRLEVDLAPIRTALGKLPPLEAATGLVLPLKAPHGALKGPVETPNPHVFSRLDAAAFAAEESAAPHPAPHAYVWLQTPLVPGLLQRQALPLPSAQRHWQYMGTWLALAFLLPAFFAAAVFKNMKNNKNPKASA